MMCGREKNRIEHRGSCVFVCTAFLLMLILTLAACGKANQGKVVYHNPIEVLSAGQDSTSVQYVQYSTSVRITELMPANKTVLPGEYASFPDWIELTNPGLQECNLKGYGLSDMETNLLQWTFPDCTLSPGERVIVYCTGIERQGLYTTFSLSKSGESIYFSDPNGNVIQRIDYGETDDDVSVFVNDGTLSYSRLSSPGFPDTEEGHESFLNFEENQEPLVINEVVPFNESYNYMKGGYYDWVELKNVSDEPVNVGEYCLSDKLSQALSYRLPDTVLNPGQFLIVFCVGDEDLSRFSVPTCSFSVDSGGDSVYLFHSDGTLADRVGVYDIPLRGSVGRLEGENGFFLFEKATPKKENANGYRQRSEMPTASISAGIYNDVESLSVELFGDGTIYYTLDGSWPTEKSAIYQEPITVTKTSSIRATVKSEGKMLSNCATFSYIINENHSLPVVYLSCTRYEFGKVYENTFYSDIYCDTNISYFGDDGTFSADCRLKLHGASSREVLIKKHFKLVFSARYGGDLKYDVFGNGTDSEYHSLLLRGDMLIIHQFRDALAAKVANVVSVTEPYALNSKYCILYIDGEYWGIYSIREAYSEKYVSDRTGEKENEVEIKRAPVTEYDDPESLTSIFQFIARNIMSDSDNYAFADEKLDLQSFAQWLCLESYFNNNDPTGNIRYVRSTAEGSKWRAMFFDLDQSMSNENTDWSIIYRTDTQIGGVLNSLCKSDEFKKLVLKTAAELMQNGLGDELVTETLNNMAAETIGEMPRNMKRWFGYMDYYESSMQDQLDCFTPGRTTDWLERMKTALKVDDETLHSYFPEYY